MKARHVLPIVILLAACANDYVISPSLDQNKTYSVAVLPASGPKPESTATLGTLSDCAGMALMKTGRFSCVERSRIDAVMKEQELDASGVVDGASAAKLGKVLGADAVLLTNVAYTTRESIPNFGVAWKSQLIVKLVSSSTAEVLYYGQGYGSGFGGPVNAWQMALNRAVGPLKRKG